MIIIATYWPGHQSAFDTWSTGARVLYVVAVLGAIALVVRLANRLQRGNSNGSERKEALRLGIAVSDVERDMPQFTQGNQSCELVRGSCARYSLPRQGGGTRSIWSLLQRTRRDGAQLANGYLLQGEVSDALRQDLTKLATEFSEDYFEFEGTTTDVGVYWEERGGASQVQQLHEILQRLAGL